MSKPECSTGPESATKLGRYPLGTGVSIGDLGKLSESCRFMKELGYEYAYPGVFMTVVPAAETNAPCWDVFFRDDDNWLLYWPESHLREAKTIIDGEGLKVESAHYSQLLGPPDKPFEWMAAQHRRMLDVAQAFGLRYVTTHAGFALGTATDRFTDGAYSRFLKGELGYEELSAAAASRRGGKQGLIEQSLEMYRFLCEEAGKRGIRPTVETACSELFEANRTPDGLLRFLAQIGTENVGACLDTGHVHISGLPVPEVVVALGASICETHVHDNRGATDEHAPVGAGTIDWPAVVEAFDQIDYPGVIMFEQKDYARNLTAWRGFEERA